MTNKKHTFSVNLLSDCYNDESKQPTAVCSQCGCEDQRAAGLFFEGRKPRIVLCERCLTKLQTVIRKGRHSDFSRWGITLKRYNGHRVCTYFNETEKLAEYSLLAQGMNLKLCADCLNVFYQTLRKYNEENNSLYIEYKESRKEVNILKSDLENEECFRKQLQELLAKNQDIELAGFVLSLPKEDRTPFFNQFNLYDTYSKPYQFKRSDGINPFPDASKDILVEQAYPFVRCNVHSYEEEPKEANLFIYNPRKVLSDFKICLCFDCAKDFTAAIKSIVADPQLQKISCGAVCIERETEYNTCYHCGGDSHFFVQMQNVSFHICEYCLGRIYRKVDAYLDKQLPDYESGKIIFGKGKPIYIRTLSKHTNLPFFRLNTKLKDVNTPDFKFVSRKLNTTYRCDCLAHEECQGDVYVLTTNNRKIDFTLFLDKQCRNSLIQLFEEKNTEKVLNKGGEILKIKPAQLTPQEHCLFCTCSEGQGWLVNIGKFDFYIDNEHRIQLLRKLDSLKF